MEEKEFMVLAGKVADGIASEAELTLYNAYYTAYQRAYPIWDELNQAERGDLVKQAKAGIDAQLLGEVKVKATRLWPRWTAVAAAVAAITLSVWLYYGNMSPDVKSDDVVYKNDIAPGKNTATLTLANGKTIALSDAKTGVVIGEDQLAYNDGSEIASIPRYDEVEMLTASTPRGGTYQVVLPDGTLVWLNAASSIKFPSRFTDSERIVELTGEAYFEVKTSYTSLREPVPNSLRERRTKQSFMVRSSGQEVTVLGTHFNISTYQDEPTVKTTLLEGSINVNGKILIPNQQAILMPNKRIQVKQVDPSEAVAWKNGQFVFNDETLESVMRKVSRWYNVEVVYDGADRQKSFYGSVSRFENISSLIKILESTKVAHFKIEGRRLTVMK